MSLEYELGYFCEIWNKIKSFKLCCEVISNIDSPMFIIFINMSPTLSPEQKWRRLCDLILRTHQKNIMYDLLYLLMLSRCSSVVASFQEMIYGL